MLASIRHRRWRPEQPPLALYASNLDGLPAKLKQKQNEIKEATFQTFYLTKLRHLPNTFCSARSLT